MIKRTREELYDIKLMLNEWINKGVDCLQNYFNSPDRVRIMMKYVEQGDIECLVSTNQQVSESPNNLIWYKKGSLRLKSNKHSDDMCKHVITNRLYFDLEKFVHDLSKCIYQEDIGLDAKVVSSVITSEYTNKVIAPLYTTDLN